MRRLKSRNRADGHVNDRRTEKKSYGRWVYLGLLGLLAIGVLDYVWGDFLVFRANGLVVQERLDIEAEYIGRLDEIPLRIGQRVEKGDVVAVVTSVEIAERLADLSLRVAELTQRDLEKAVDIEIAENLLPIADKRVTNSRIFQSQLAKLSDKGLATADRLLDVMTENNTAEEGIIRLKARLAADKTAKAALQPALKQTQTAISDLNRLYGGGVIRSPVSGVVDSTLPARGEVFLTGEQILSLYSGRKFVLAYLPTRYLFPVGVGEKVTLSSGQMTVQGVVAEILPVSDALPKEFQNTFKPAERNQLARIQIEHDASFPLHTKVDVTRTSLIWQQIVAFAKTVGLKVRTAFFAAEETKISSKADIRERVENVFRTIE
jgi:multidrug resistance efflux pump